MIGAALAASLVTGLTACSPGGGAANDPNAASGAATNGCSQEEQIAALPLEQRVSQMLMGGVSADMGEMAVNAAIRGIARDWVGGVNFLGNSSYAYSDNQLAQAVDAGGQIPPFLAVDEEGGRVQRLAEETGFLPSAREMANTKTPEQVQKQAEEIGRVMRKNSLNMDLAPVVDVSKQPADAVIGDRAFSNDPEEVTKYAGAFANGLREADVIPVLKHFPGLGAGSGNTDFEPATTPPLSRLKKSDLVPYETLLLEEPVAVMFTNAKVPGLTKGKPASLSKAAYDLLREEYGFEGVTMTDSLSAAAILEGAELDEAIEDALIAGADIALWDSLSTAPDIRRSLVQAVRQDRLSTERVNESVGRILALKGVDLCVGR